MTNGANTTTITSSATGTFNLILPIAQGSSGAVLSNDGSGNLSWNYVPRLYYALQGILNDYTTIMTDASNPGIGTILPINSLTSGNSSILRKSVKKEYSFPGVTSFRSNDNMICPSTGWYQISCSLFHPYSQLIGGIDNQSGMGNFRVGIKFTAPTIDSIVEHGYIDTNTDGVYSYGSKGGAPDVCSYNGTMFLEVNDKFEFRYEGGDNKTNQDILVRITIMKLTDGTTGTT